VEEIDAIATLAIALVSVFLCLPTGGAMPSVAGLSSEDTL